MVNTSFLALFLALAIGGIIDSSYLMWKHRQKKPLICPLDHKCDVVTESRWSHLFYFRNETLGLVFYVGLLVGGVAVLLVPPWGRTLLFLFLVGSVFGTVFSFVLLYIQLRVIKDYCFYCIISAIITLLLLGMSGLLYVG